MLSPSRAAVADYTFPLWTDNVKMVSGLRGLMVDPWSFLLPLTFLVWVVTLASLLGVFATLQMFPSCLPGRTLARDDGWQEHILSCVRIILQQGKASRTMLSPSWLVSVWCFKGFCALREQQLFPNEL